MSAGDGFFFSVDILEPDGNVAHESYPASCVQDAKAKASAAACRGPKDKILKGCFDKLHLGNRIPGSHCKTYHGELLVDGACLVSVIGADQIRRELRPRLDLANHSPTGFSWDFAGSSPAQLSLALLADALGDDERALRLYQPFKFAVTARLPQDKAWFASEDVIAILATHVDAQGRPGRGEAA
ncbi:MAG: DUF6166 domain-containing protein [Geminicoccaceae bacterium]